MSVKRNVFLFLGVLALQATPHLICTASLLELTDRFKTGKGCMAQDPLQTFPEPQKAYISLDQNNNLRRFEVQFELPDLAVRFDFQIVDPETHLGAEHVGFETNIGSLHPAMIA